MPFWNLFPCASSFAMETGNQKHKTTGAVVGKCALLYRSGVLLASNASVGTNAKKHLLGEPKPHSGKAGFTQFLLTQPELARGGPSVRCGGVPPRDPHPHPDGKTPSGAHVRRGSEERPVSAYGITNYLISQESSGKPTSMEPDAGCSRTT